MQAGLNRAGITRSDIDVKGESYETTTHFGNWVLTPILAGPKTEALAEALADNEAPGVNLHLLDMPDAILEPGDLDGFYPGQKVTVRFLNGFCSPVQERGTVIRISATEITILKHRCRKIGWSFCIGQRAEIQPEAA